MTSLRQPSPENAAASQVLAGARAKGVRRQFPFPSSIAPELIKLDPQRPAPLQAGAFSFPSPACGGSPAVDTPVSSSPDRPFRPADHRAVRRIPMFEGQPQAEVEALLKANAEFRQLYHRHKELDKQVLDAELGVLPVDDVRLSQMKREKLAAKDRLTRMYDELHH